MAFLSHLWMKNPTVRQPFLQPIGTVKRRGKSGSSVLSDFVALRKSLFLCHSCEHKMPRNWVRRFEYRLIPGLHADACRCDGCQQVGACNIFHPEEGGYYQEHARLHRITDAAATQRLALRTTGRIPGT